MSNMNKRITQEDRADLHALLDALINRDVSFSLFAHPFRSDDRVHLLAHLDPEGRERPRAATPSGVTFPFRVDHGVSRVTVTVFDAKHIGRGVAYRDQPRNVHARIVAQAKEQPLMSTPKATADAVARRARREFDAETARRAARGVRP